MYEFPLPIHRGKYNKICLTENQISWFKNFYSQLSTAQLCEITGMSNYAVTKITKELGLFNYRPYCHRI